MLVSVDDLKGGGDAPEATGLSKVRDVLVVVDETAGGIFLEVSARGTGSGKASLVSSRGTRAGRIGPAQPVSELPGIAWMRESALRKT